MIFSAAMYVRDRLEPPVIDNIWRTFTIFLAKLQKKRYNTDTNKDKYAVYIPIFLVQNKYLDS